MARLLLFLVDYREEFSQAFDMQGRPRTAPGLERLGPGSYLLLTGRHYGFGNTGRSLKDGPEKLSLNGG